MHHSEKPSPPQLNSEIYGYLFVWQAILVLVWQAILVFCQRKPSQGVHDNCQGCQLLAAHCDTTAQTLQIPALCLSANSLNLKTIQWLHPTVQHSSMHNSASAAEQESSVQPLNCSSYQQKSTCCGYIMVDKEPVLPIGQCIECNYYILTHCLILQWRQNKSIPKNEKLWITFAAFQVSSLEIFLPFQWSGRAFVHPCIFSVFFKLSSNARTS